MFNCLIQLPPFISPLTCYLLVIDNGKIYIYLHIFEEHIHEELIFYKYKIIIKRYNKGKSIYEIGVGTDNITNTNYNYRLGRTIGILNIYNCYYVGATIIFIVMHIFMLIVIKLCIL